MDTEHLIIHQPNNNIFIPSNNFTSHLAIKFLISLVLFTFVISEVSRAPISRYCFFYHGPMDTEHLIIHQPNNNIFIPSNNFTYKVHQPIDHAVASSCTLPTFSIASLPTNELLGPFFQAVGVWARVRWGFA